MNMKKMCLLGLIVSATITVGAAEKRVVARNDFYSDCAPATNDRGTELGAEVVDATQDAAERSGCCRLWGSVKRNKKRIATVGCLAVATAYYFRDPNACTFDLSDSLSEIDAISSSRHFCKSLRRKIAPILCKALRTFTRCSYDELYSWKQELSDAAYFKLREYSCDPTWVWVTLGLKVSFDSSHLVNCTDVLT